MSIEHLQNVKLPATIKSQIEKLISRGCIINDISYAEEILSSINYYRLTHYFSVFLIDKHSYKEGTTFEMGVRLYDFDRSLRNLMLDMLEEIEISLRAIISNYHALKYGAIGYLNPSSFDRSHKHPQFLSKIEHLIEINGDNLLVAHHKNKYNGYFPLWAIMELFSFGTLAYFYEDMKTEDKDNIAEKSFSNIKLDRRQLDSWLDRLSELRNQCAHYNRVYGGPAPEEPRIYESEDFTAGDGYYRYIYIMKLLCKRQSIWENSFVPALKTLINSYDDVVQIECLGFPNNWEEIFCRKL